MHTNKVKFLFRIFKY